jgi:hypothetical protein
VSEVEGAGQAANQARPHLTEDFAMTTFLPDSLQRLKDAAREVVSDRQRDEAERKRQALEFNWSRLCIEIRKLPVDLLEFIDLVRPSHFSETSRVYHCHFRLPGHHPISARFDRDDLVTTMPNWHRSIMTSGKPIDADVEGQLIWKENLRNTLHATLGEALLAAEMTGNEIILADPPADVAVIDDDDIPF